MSRRLFESLMFVGLMVVSLAAFTLWALEADGVAVLGTRGEDGQLRETRVWYVQADDQLWLEAASPESPWLSDVARDSGLHFSAAAHSGSYAAEVLAGEAPHRRIRDLLRAKYGLRDLWINVLVDTSRSVAVRLTPDETGKADDGDQDVAAVQEKSP